MNSSAANAANAAKSSLKLSPRLQALFDQLLPGQEVWDIACDHGLVGLRAIESNRFSHIHFVDPVPSILAKLKNYLAGCADVSFHQQRACDLAGPILGSVIFAGVGANTIINDIECLMIRKVLRAQKVSLSPHKDSEIFLKRLETEASHFFSSYKLIERITIEENSRLRNIFVFQRQGTS